VQSGEWRDETDWHNIVLWKSENVSNYLTKGKSVYIEGRLQTRNYDDKDGNKRYMTEVVAEELILLGGRGEGGGQAPSEMGAPSNMVSMPRSAMPSRSAAPSPGYVIRESGTASLSRDCFGRRRTVLRRRRDKEAV